MISERCPLGLSDEELSRWYDDDLPTARMEAIRVHSASCPACRERLAAFAEIGAGLRDLTPPPLDLARLLAGLLESPPPNALTSTPVQPSDATTRSPALMAFGDWRGRAGSGAAALALRRISLREPWANTTRRRRKSDRNPRPVVLCERLPIDDFRHRNVIAIRRLGLRQQRDRE
jgi:anti-sigma factor RsiW